MRVRWTSQSLWLTRRLNDARLYDFHEGCIFTRLFSSQLVCSPRRPELAAPHILLRYSHLSYLLRFTTPVEILRVYLRAEAIDILSTLVRRLL